MRARVYYACIWLCMHAMEKQPEVVKYTLRRWDAFHVFSATRFALFLGFPIGLFFRIILQFTVFQSRWEHISYTVANFPRQFPNISCEGIVELVLLVLLLLSLFGLYRLFGHARTWVSEQYSNVSFAIINKSGIRRWQLQEIFPPEYFDQNFNGDG